MASGLSVPGSKWDSRHLTLLNIIHTHSEFHEFSDHPRHDEDFASHLESISVTEAETAPRRDFYRDTYNLGPLRSLLSAIKEQKGVVDDQFQPRRSGRERKAPELFQPSRSATKGKGKAPATDMLSESESTGDSFTTDESAHARRATRETVSNCLIYLFLECVLENSEARQMTSKNGCYLEWHVEPFKFSIAALNIRCHGINDGCLFSKGLGPTGRWSRSSDLVYCSIEAKRQFTLWEDEGTESQQNDEVRAQEACELIGMMCQRLQRAFELNGRERFDLDKLSEYDRTTYLITGVQRSLILKRAVFSKEYLEQFLYPSVLEDLTSPEQHQTELAESADPPSADPGTLEAQRREAPEPQGGKGSGASAASAPTKSGSNLGVPASAPAHSSIDDRDASLEPRKSARLMRGPKPTYSEKRIARSSVKKGSRGRRARETGGKKKQTPKSAVTESTTDPAPGVPQQSPAAKLVIEVSEQYDISRGTKASGIALAARVCVALVEELQNQGPLLQAWSTAQSEE